MEDARRTHPAEALERFSNPFSYSTHTMPMKAGPFGSFNWKELLGETLIPFFSNGSFLYEKSTFDVETINKKE